MKRWLIQIVPWVITAVALYCVFTGLDWEMFLSNLMTANPLWILGAIVLTAISYLMRSFRWQYFFPNSDLSFVQACKALFLGFFMNNVLPARTGELVRAHMGSQLTGEKRTLVLATIASERLVDGLTLSLMFVVFAVGPGVTEVSVNLLYVALAFGLAAVAVVAMLAMRSHVFTFADKIGGKFNHKASDFAVDRFQVFIEGLSPLCTWSRIPAITVWSLLVWFIELGVYVCIAQAFGETMALAHCVLFLVAVNFSSLVPSAPGAIGVIEFIATNILVSIGIPREHALSMVVTQHTIQYLVVGIPGLLITLAWKKQIMQFKESQNDES